MRQTTPSSLLRRRVADWLVRHPTAFRSASVEAMRRRRLESSLEEGGVPDPSLRALADRLAREGRPAERYRGVVALLRLGRREDALSALRQLAADAPALEPSEQLEAAHLLARHTLVEEADAVFLGALADPRGGAGVLGAARYVLRDVRPELVDALDEAVEAGRTRVRGKTGEKVEQMMATLHALRRDRPAEEVVAAAAPLAEAVRGLEAHARRTNDRGLGRALGMLADEGIDDPEEAAAVAQRHDRYGEIERAVRLAQRVRPALGDPTVLDGLVETGRRDLRLLQDGWRGGARAPRAHDPAPRRAAYLLHNSLPFDSGGYATRSHGILTALTATGWDVDALNRPGYPWDRPRSLARTGGAVVPAQRIDGVPYARLSDGPAGLPGPLDRYIEAYADALVARNTDARYGVIHAASFFHNGLAGIRAARRLGIPSVYEVRGTHDLLNTSRDADWAATDRGRLFHMLEDTAVREADRVFVITRAVRDLMIERGADGRKIRVLPNAVDSSRFGALPRDTELARELGVDGYPVIGYVGSMVFYEGLEMLVAAADVLKSRGVRFKLLVVGDGEVAPRLHREVEEKGLGDVVVFTGRVPHHEVERYYSLVDVAPFPRTSSPVTEAVSPLKPFEALAMERAVVVSSVAALTEIITDGENGMVFVKDDVASLVSVLERLVNDEPLRRAVAARGREWVVRERDWKVVVGTVDETYRELADEFGTAGSWLPDAVPGAAPSDPV